MNRKLLFYISAIFIICIGAFALDSCEDIVTCINQDNDPYCLVDDTSCTFTKYIDSDGSCVVDNSYFDSDGDNDGWTDGCDAFINDNTEWIDVDGDGIGHNKDCDDFDSDNQDICNSDTTTTTSSTTTISSSTSTSITTSTSTSTSTSSSTTTTIPAIAAEKENNGGSLKYFCTAAWECSEWGACADGIKARECTKTNNCGDESNKPEEVKICPSVSVLTLKSEAKGGINQGNESEPLKNGVPVEPTSDEDNTQTGDLPKVTGMISLIGGTISWLFLMILLVLLLLFVYFKHKKK
ncbi:hypothetical protein JW930_02880 [Candidatus Woesearchaeota archaeon]|nr:hypothetical protein [Candidatus Woesearchaeota archaeon]